MADLDIWRVRLYNLGMASHIPNSASYRPWLGECVNASLFKLVAKKNSDALTQLSVSDYLEKMILHWYQNEFPNEPLPFRTKRFVEDFDFVQSV